jgi:E1A/CREB-binding protein
LEAMNPINNMSNVQVHAISSNFLTSQMKATLVPCIKDWHRSVPKHLRNHCVQKIFSAFSSKLAPVVLQDKRILNVVVYARKIESDLYNLANSKQEYCKKLAENIYKIQKIQTELMEKRQNKEKRQQTLMRSE